MSPKKKKINHHKVMCGFEICLSVYMVQCEWNAWKSWHIQKLISDSEISHSIRSGEDRKERLIN